MNITRIRNTVNRIEGWLTDKEGLLLFNLAKRCKGRGIIVEIGSWKGKSTVWLAEGSKAGNNLKVYAIDPHTGCSHHGKVWTFDEFKKNIETAEVDDLIVPIVKTSEEAANYFNEPVEFIFIDGAHEYELVKLDFMLWYPKVVNGGVMAFHDTIMWRGPKKVVDKFVYRSRHFKNVSFVDSITFAQKVTHNSLMDCLRNRTVLFKKNLYGIGLRLPRSVRIMAKKFIRIFSL